MTRYWRLLTVFCLAFSSAAPVYADQAVLGADTYITSLSPTTNFCTAEKLAVDNASVALMKFDLAQLGAGKGAAEVQSASLRLYINSMQTAGNVAIYQVISPWDECEVTFSAGPTMSFPAVATVAISPANAMHYISVDISALVRSWIANPGSNLGVAILPALGNANAAVLLDSQKSTTTSHPAHLEVALAYIGPTGPPGPVGPQGPPGPVAVAIGTVTGAPAGASPEVTGASSAAAPNIVLPTASFAVTAPSGNSAPSATFTTLVAGSINQIVHAEMKAGNTADAKITACLAAVSGGGTCDATGFGATTQTMASTVTVNAGQRIIFDPVTKFQAGAVNTNLFVIEPGAQVKGFTFDCANFPAYAGTLFQNDPTKGYGRGDATLLDDISTTLACGGNITGTVLKLNATSTAGVGFFDRRHWRIVGFLNGELLTSTSPGWVNGTHASDLVFQGTKYGQHFNNAGGLLTGNMCMECTYEASWDPANQAATVTGINAWLFDGTCTASDQAMGNQRIGNSWDAAVPAFFQNCGSPGAVSRNMMIGWITGTISDPSGYNSLWWNTSNGSFRLANSMGAEFDAAVQLGKTSTNSIDGSDGVNIALRTNNRVYFGNGANGYIDNAGNASFANYEFKGTPGFSGTKTAGNCTLVIQGGIITSVTGC